MWKNTLLNSANVVMHLESKFTMSLVFATTVFFWVFFFLCGGGGGGTLSLGCPDQFEFQISGPLHIFIKSICLRSLAAIVSEKSTVFTFSYRKA